MSQQSHQGRQSPPSERELGLIEASEARADLYDTLGQLRVRLDYAQRIAAEKRENPLVFGAAVVGVAAVCGVAVWAIASKVVRAFQ